MLMSKQDQGERLFMASGGENPIYAYWAGCRGADSMWNALSRVVPMVVLTMSSFSQAGAVNVVALDIQNSGDSYSVVFEVIVAADAEKARDILANYVNWPRLSDTIIESQSIQSFPSGAVRIGVTFRACVVAGFFCKVIRQVKNLETADGGYSFASTLVPERSDFAGGNERWQIKREGINRTRLRYDATLLVGFSVPAFVGPWVMKRVFRRELIESARKLEELVAQ